MAVTPASLLEPAGLVTPSLFPGEGDATLTARLQAYINEGDEKTATDAGIRAWAYHRAFMAVWIRLTTNPNTENFQDQGGHSFLQSQIENVKRIADEQLALFTSLTTSATTSTSGTTSTGANFSW